MDFAPSARTADLTARVAEFMAAEVTPVEPAYHRDLAEARRTGDPNPHASALDVRSVAYVRQEQWSQALAAATEALNHYQRANVIEPLGYTMNVQGLAYLGLLPGLILEARDVARDPEQARRRGSSVPAVAATPGGHGAKREQDERHGGERRTAHRGHIGANRRCPPCKRCAKRAADRLS